ncbi:MAG: hypothetical protein AAF685_05995 [Cyanobacteria bacterium P01_C01_bin.89]
MQSQTADFSTTDAVSDPTGASVEGVAGDGENNSADPTANTAATSATSEEVGAVIAELEAYRQRLVDDTMDIARKIKLPKKAAQAQVDSHPEIAKVTQLIQGLRDRQNGSAQ